MARLDKTELKSIIKECLIEILAEGLAPNPGAGRQSRKRKMNEAFSGKRQKSQESAELRKRRSYLDTITVGDQKRQAKSPLRKEHMQKITSDPLMQEILSDTATTTLVAQGTANAKNAKHVHTAPADKAAQIVQEHDPTELFSESAKNWATLAFS